jgi:hypothetical protein
MNRKMRDAGVRVADKLFQHRFVQQFAALFYKNGKQRVGGLVKGVELHKQQQVGAPGWTCLDAERQSL